MSEISTLSTSRNLRRAAIVVGLLVCSFAVGLSWFSWRSESAREVKALSALAEVGAQSMDSYLLGLQAALRLASEQILDESGNVDLARANATLARVKAARTELRVLTLALPDGTVVASSEGAMQGPRPSLAKQPTFVAMREEKLRTRNPDMTIGRVFFGPMTKEWVIPVGYVVWTPKGEMAAIIGAGLSVASPQALWKDAPLPPNAALGLRRDDGYFLIRYPIPGSMTLEQLYAKPSYGPLGEYLRSNNYPVRGHVQGVSRTAQEDTVFAFRRLNHFPLTFFVTNPVSNVLAEWWTEARGIYVMLLLLLLGGYYIYRWALRQQLAWDEERARRIAMLETTNQALEDFAYTIAHDLKSPVRAIDGHAGLALADPEAALPEGTRHRLGQIRRSATRMAELIDDLLQFSRYSRAVMEKKVVDMDALARTVIAEVVPADEGIELTQGKLPPCDGDLGLLRVVWTALLSNAVKYSARSQPQRIEIGFRGGRYFVRDNGVGFDMGHSAKLFGVFSRLHGAEEFEGTGAGLAIARRILQRHGGSISAEGVPGEGATFSFTVAPDAGSAQQ